jgi:hypothetical protein
MGKKIAPMSFWDDFIGAVDDVVTVGSKLLPIGLALAGASASAKSSDAELDYPIVGNIAFYPGTGYIQDGDSGPLAYTGVYMTNLSPLESTVTFGYAGSASTEVMFNLSGHEAVPVGNTPNIFGTFDSGKINVAVAQPPSLIQKDGGATKVIAYSVASLLLSVAARIFPGFTVTIQRLPNGGYTGSLVNNNSFPIESVVLQVRDSHGASGQVAVNVPANPNGADDAQPVIVQLPATLDLIDGVAELDVTATVPAYDYDGMFVDQRRRTVKASQELLNRLSKKLGVV